MFPVFRTQLLLALIAFTASSNISADEIAFDVPAIVGVSMAEDLTSKNTTTVEFRLPISTSIERSLRGKVTEFRFDVSWNRSVYPIFDYSPKSQTESDVDGLLSVEQTDNNNFNLSSSISGKPLQLLAANLNSDIGRGSSTRVTYRKIPQQQIFVASGTIDRGTGAFFRFHPSPSRTLEGSHNLMLSYRVPKTWRNGLLKVECRAIGKRRVIGLWDEPFEISRSFVVPLYLEDELTSQQFAIDFAKAEQDLRKAWLGFKAELKKNHKQNPIAAFTKYRPEPPEQWPHLLIQSGDERYISQFEGYLTREVVDAANHFVQARKRLTVK